MMQVFSHQPNIVMAKNEDCQVRDPCLLHQRFQCVLREPEDLSVPHLGLGNLLQFSAYGVGQRKKFAR